MKTKLFKSVFCLFVMTLILIACKKDDESTPANGEINVEFENQVKSQDVTLKTQVYTNAHGDKYKIDLIRYWISNVKLKKADGTVWAAPDSYYLIEQTSGEKTNIDNQVASRSSFSIEDVPHGEYTGVEFSIGVDADRNASLDKKAGELSENVGMSWTWATGYIFMKVDGSVDTTGAGQYKPFMYHIGTNACYKAISTTFPNKLIIDKGREAELHYKTQFDKLFDSPNVIDLKSNPVIMGGTSGLPLKVAENYGTSVFVLDHVHND